MVPAGIEPDLFDHPQPEKFRQQISARWPPGGHVHGRLECLSADRLSVARLRGRFARKAGRVAFVVSPLVSEALENAYTQQLAPELGISDSIDLDFAPPFERFAQLSRPRRCLRGAAARVPRSSREVFELHARRQTGCFFRRRRERGATICMTLSLCRITIGGARPGNCHSAE